MEPLERQPPLPPDVEAAVQQRPAEEQQRIRAAWALLGAADPPLTEVPSADAAWDALAHRTAPPARPTQRRPAQPRPAREAPHRPRRRLHPGWVAGACAIALLAVATAVWRQPAVVQAPPGQRLAVTLPDGSSVHLNGGSRLEHRRRFAAWPGVPAEERIVRLAGEAFFEVRTDGRPFAVLTHNARVDVLGTRFNVRAWPTSQAAPTEVTLSEGRVRAVSAAGGADVLLDAPGQRARIGRTSGAPDVQRVDLERALAWRRGGFIVEDQPVDAVLAELERVFGVQIDVEGALALEEPMTLRYHQPVTAAAVLHDLCLERGWRYRRTSRGFALSPGAPRP